jgi:D-sedoheptulose 7-phosphate isomerase
VKENIVQQIEESIAVQKEIFGIVDSILEVSQMCADALKVGKRLFFCGNGGSAADSQHLATEFVVRLSKRKAPREALPAMALTTNTSLLTAASNDYGFDKVFSRQIEALARSGDVLFGISTSGNSENVINAIKAAKERSVITVGLTGNNGGKMKEHCDYLLSVTSDYAPRVQESHITIGHILCDTIEEFYLKD